MKSNIYIYITVMALVTYLIRVLPLTLIKKDIKSPFLRSFLYYVPYVTLSVMTFPAILFSSANWIAALAAFIVAVFLAYKNKSLVTVALAACITVFVLELFI
jgi:Predicted membrane protein